MFLIVEIEEKIAQINKRVMIF